MFLIFSLEAFSQFLYCDSLNVSHHQTHFDSEGIENTIDFINMYFPKQRRYVSDRNELKAINIWYNSDSTIVFQDNANEIKIIFKTRYFDPTKIFYPKSPGEKYSTIREYEEGLPYGITSEDTIFTCISEIFINNKKIPSSYFSDLFNPNKYETILSIKPINVYKSKCGQYLYIYIFGKLNTDIMTMNEAAGFSYMAKLIVSTKGNYIDRIVVSGDKLKYFGFGECPDFKGF
jgi:hypothetical protein